MTSLLQLCIVAIATRIIANFNSCTDLAYTSARPKTCLAYIYSYDLKMMLSGHMWRQLSCVSSRKSFLLLFLSCPTFPKTTDLYLYAQVELSNPKGGAWGKRTFCSYDLWCSRKAKEGHKINCHLKNSSPFFSKLVRVRSSNLYTLLIGIINPYHYRHLTYLFDFSL